MIPSTSYTGSEWVVGCAVSLQPRWSLATSTMAEPGAISERLLEEVRRCLRGEPSGDLAHRRQEGKAAVLRLDGLVRDGGDAAVHERARQRLIGGDVEVGEENEPLAKARVLRLDRLLDLEE